MMDMIVHKCEYIYLLPACTVYETTDMDSLNLNAVPTWLRGLLDPWTVSPACVKNQSLREVKQGITRCHDIVQSFN